VKGGIFMRENIVGNSPDDVVAEFEKHHPNYKCVGNICVVKSEDIEYVTTDIQKKETGRVYRNYAIGRLEVKMGQKLKEEDRATISRFLKSYCGARVFESSKMFFKKGIEEHGLSSTDVFVYYTNENKMKTVDLKEIYNTPEIIKPDDFLAYIVD
jgi:hypothetical protein